ncbi:MAG TPA: DUF4439 domain-containing protein [Propionibacteriaceae bacterium]|nr:DUF4439 domain-containing protein [Propionibacteriaceae bacterium]
MPHAPASRPGEALSRRALLVGGGGAALGLLTSCSWVPGGGSVSGDGSPGSPPGAGEPPLTPYADLAAELAAAADDFDAMAAHPGVPSATAGWAAAAGRMSRAQAARLRLADPLSTPPAAAASPSAPGSPTPSPTGPAPGPTALLASIAGRQRGLESRFRDRCLAADAGDLALLLASLAVTAHAVRAPSVAVSSGGASPHHVDVGSRDDALAVLLSRVDALAQGLEVGLGALPLHDPSVSTGEARLTQVWALRDDVEAMLVQASAPPTPGPLVYDLPGRATSPSAVRALWGRLESDVMAAWLRVAAASSGEQRGAAVDAAAAQQDRAAALATPVTWWPGWV